jgi:hypothetical protein
VHWKEVESEKDTLKELLFTGAHSNNVNLGEQLGIQVHMLDIWEGKSNH